MSDYTNQHSMPPWAGENSNEANADQITALQAKVKELEGQVLGLREAVTAYQEQADFKFSVQGSYGHFDRARKAGLEALTATKETAERVRREIQAEAIRSAEQHVDGLANKMSLSQYADDIESGAQQLRGGGE